MGTFERLQRIREHFANISIEEFERNLQRAGIEEIRPSADFGYEMVSPGKIVTHYDTAEKRAYHIPEKQKPSSSMSDNFSYADSWSMGLAA